MRGPVQTAAMGAQAPQELWLRSHRASAQSYGPPVAGKSVTLTMSGADQTVALDGSAVYRIVADDAQPAYIGSAACTDATNRMRLAAGSEIRIQTPPAGMTLHYLQAGTAGSLYLSQHDDVG